MKKLLIAATMALSFGASSQDKPANICGSINELAGVIMELRQKGVEMIDVIAIADSAPAEIEKLSKELIIAAYESPQFSGSEYQQKAVTNFKNEAYLTCIKSVK